MEGKIVVYAFYNVSCLSLWERWLKSLIWAGEGPLSQKSKIFDSSPSGEPRRLRRCKQQFILQIIGILDGHFIILDESTGVATLGIRDDRGGLGLPHWHQRVDCLLFLLHVFSPYICFSVMDIRSLYFVHTTSFSPVLAEKTVKYSQICGCLSQAFMLYCPYRLLYAAKMEVMQCTIVVIIFLPVLRPCPSPFLKRFATR